MSSAPYFPNEILKLIFRQFCSHCCDQPVSISSLSFVDEALSHQSGCQTLSSLCLVSKRFQDIAQPLLYHKFIAGYRHDEPPAALHRQFISFTQTIIQRRDLSKIVEKVCIQMNLPRVSFSPGPSWQIRLRRPPPSPLPESTPNVEKILDTLRAAAHILAPSTFSQPDDASAGTKAHEEDKVKSLFSPMGGFGQLFNCESYLATELVLTLIALLPNATHAVLQTCGHLHSDEQNYLPLALQVFDQPNLAIKTMETDWSVPSLVRITHSTIHLENLHIHQCSRFPLGRIFTIPPMPNLKHLSLTHCRLDSPGLKYLIGQCTGKLYSFTYEPPGYGKTAHNNPLGHSAHYFSLKYIAGMLGNHCQTLKSLHLDYRHSTLKLSLSELRNFASLTHLFYGHYSLSYALNIFPSTNLSGPLLPHTLESLGFAGAEVFHQIRHESPTHPAPYYSTEPPFEDYRYEDEASFSRGLLDLAKAKQLFPGAFANLNNVYCISNQVPAVDVSTVTPIFASAGVKFRFRLDSEAHLKYYYH
ncbi:hypothetical protein PT974_10898 [Cladobotryum mycophilum]|uniref:F-box domain-containing protein n=1 Tax=Cladobotryum mycophilum TaxID=491253 RepID=A0ABR0SB37_9HYPO